MTLVLAVALALISGSLAAAGAVRLASDPVTRLFQAQADDRGPLAIPPATVNEPGKVDSDRNDEDEVEPAGDDPAGAAHDEDEREDAADAEESTDADESDEETAEPEDDVDEAETDEAEPNESEIDQPEADEPDTDGDADSSDTGEAPDDAGSGSETDD